MPNLLVTVNGDLPWDTADLRQVAARMERVLHQHMGLPIAVTNVFLNRAVAARHTVDVYAEFIYRVSPGRDATLLQGLADALSQTLPGGFDGTFAFRAFGHSSESLFSTDVTRERQASL